MLPIQIIVIFAITLRVIAFLVTSIFMLPLQIREARVNNGLKKLRYELLAYGTIILVLNICRIYALITYLLGDELLNPVQAVLLVFGSLGYIALAVIGHIMYRQNYSPENKEIHKQIEELTSKE